MASASGFFTATAFCYLIASMGLQVLWSFGLACLEIHTLRFNKDLYHHIIVSLFLVGDWVTSTLSLAAVCSSAGVMVLFARDINFCSPQNDCSLIPAPLGMSLCCLMFRSACDTDFNL